MRSKTSANSSSHPGANHAGANSSSCSPDQGANGCPGNTSATASYSDGCSSYAGASAGG